MSKFILPIPESYWVEPERFLAGEYPGHAFGEPLHQRLDSYLEIGINTFIDLTDPDELPPYLPALLEQARKYDTEIHHQRFIITDHGIPTTETMQSILDSIDTSLAAGCKIYPHCWGGIGRTGTTVGCYLVRHGRSGQQALAQLAEWWKDVPKSKIWPHSPETERQMQFVLNWKEPSSYPPP